METTAAGTVALVGAGEFLPAIGQVDVMLLYRVPGTPRVVVLPTASAPDGPAVPDRWARMGVEHFSGLGAAVEPVLLRTRADAEDPAIAARIAAANFVYLSGGKPRYLIETLRDTPSWQAIVGVWAAGGVVVGCSAGAMALVGQLLDFPRVWRALPALGLVPGLAVIPHFDELPRWLTGMAGRAGGATTVVGIDGSTALVGAGGAWQALGIGRVTVFTPKGRAVYRGGDPVPLALDGRG